LCYLIFLISYFLIKYKLWYYPAPDTKTFNPVIQKIIIHSIVDLFNGISEETGKMPNDYIYMLTSSKLYTQLNSTFKNKEIINMLKHNHIKYADKNTDDKTPVDDLIIPTYSIEKPIKVVLQPRKLPSFKVSSGIKFDEPDNVVYPIIPINTNITNCNSGTHIGDFHNWVNKGTKAMCTYCGKTTEEVDENYDSTTDSYYFNLQKIANRRCLDGKIHDFVGKEGNFVCALCGRNADEVYSRSELDKLSASLNKIENEQIELALKKVKQSEKTSNEIQEHREAIIKELLNEYRKENNDKLHGRIVIIVDQFIRVLEGLLGTNINLEANKTPVYLIDDVYIIDHSYDGSLFSQPITFKQKDNRIIFKENHPFFKSDVYYYTDNRAGQIDVFYHAVTLKLIGYKEKHKDFVLVTKTNNYLKIIYSIKNRLLMIGFETKYIDISGIFIKNSKFIKDANLNYYQILDNLVREHIFKTKMIIDKFASILYKIKNYQAPQEGDQQLGYLQTVQEIEKITSKMNKQLGDIELGSNDIAFDDWTDIRNSFTYNKIDWTETNVKANQNMFVNSELINYYDSTSSLMNYYLIKQLISILDANSEKNTKINIAQMYTEIIDYIYELYNIDSYKNIPEIKRFTYIMNGSDIMIDLMKKGQGLDQSRQLEETVEELVEVEEITEEEKEELEDLREEAEALDIEAPEYEDEEEDYVAGAGEE
jgi:hypothetical protein